MTMSPLRAFILMCALFIQASITMADDSGRLDDKAIGQAAGTQATAKPDGVVRIGWKRDDVPVTVDGMKFPPPAGLGSWAAFKALPEGGVMVMGDTVVFEDEITPAMDAAFAHTHNNTPHHNQNNNHPPPQNITRENPPFNVPPPKIL